MHSNDQRIANKSDREINFLQLYFAALGSISELDTQKFTDGNSEFPQEETVFRLLSIQMKNSFSTRPLIKMGFSFKRM